jgi:hypothetical protein
MRRPEDKRCKVVLSFELVADKLVCDIADELL